MRFFIICLCLMAGAFADDIDRYFSHHNFDKLIIDKNKFLQIAKQAKSIKLHTNKKWLNLLHTTKNTSEISRHSFDISNTLTNEIYHQDWFFYADDGHKNPEHELYESLFALFVRKDFYKFHQAVLYQDQSAISFSGDKDNLHFACRFPLRYQTLLKELNLPKLQEFDCSDYDKFIAYLEPKSMGVVFPAAYINSPASMFGHSFLIIHSRYNSRLLSHAINWAADVDENSENPIKFMLYGLIGGYDGKYSITPYYDMLKTYKDNENRDLYEYDLSLDSMQTHRLLAHLWEIKDSFSGYYFFSQNCSYNLLWLLENAVDNLELKNEFFYTVAPSKTIQIMEQKGIITNYSYRPSKLNTILAISNKLSFSQVSLAKKIAKGSVSANEALTDKDAYTILALANELCLYYATKQTISKDSYQHISHSISAALASTATSTLPRPPSKPSITLGAYPYRVGIGYWYDDKSSSALLNLRPSMHSIEENDEGFDNGIGVEFFNTDIKISRKIRLKRLHIVKLSSLSDFNSITHSPSYTLQLSYDDILGKSSPYARAMIGISKTSSDYLLSYLMGAKAHKHGISYDNTILSSIAINRAKLSLSYSKNFYSHEREDKLQASFHAKISQNAAVFATYEKAKYHLKKPSNKSRTCLANKNTCDSVMAGIYWYF